MLKINMQGVFSKAFGAKNLNLTLKTLTGIVVPKLLLFYHLIRKKRENTKISIAKTLIKFPIEWKILMSRDYLTRF